ncbi:PQQ-like beta-propeller repeat protein, partial [Myxococcota bacterium]|nr:PQQ-like beta-propeller repeat protein [Myxococcota bacterium]
MSGRDARRHRGARRRGRACSAGVGVLTALVAACGSDPGAAIVPRWKFDTTAAAAPPGIGPERRVVVAHESGPGELVTLNEENGTRVEGPFAPVFPTEHAPVVTGTTIVLVSSIGRLVGYDFAGQTRFSVPDAPFGLSGPIAVAPDGSLRIATTSGRLLGHAADGAPLFDTSIDGAATSRLAVSANGTAYAATDIGRVVGVDATGAIVFDVDVPAPASGPSLGPDGRVAVGTLDGVSVFDASGGALWSRARAARVVGTRYLDDGRLVAWGEDGIVEILGASGDVQGTF